MKSTTLLLSVLGSFAQVSLSAYTEYNNGYYIGVYTGGSSLTWYEAQSYCQTQFGTELGSIHSSTDNTNAINALNGAGMPNIITGSRGGTAGNNAWIGYNDIGSEGTFGWSDGSANDFTNWHAGEPNNCCTGTVPAGEDCTHIWGGGTWNDMSCNPTLLNWVISGFVCNTNPCTNDDSWYDLTGNANVVGCHGTFSGGMDSNTVDAICGNGWHVCDSAQETVDLGLTLAQCQSVGTNEIFFARESSNGGAQCESENNPAGTNDVWGCSGGLTSDWNNVCLNLYDATDSYDYPTCKSMSHFCWSGHGGTIYDGSGNPVVGFGSGSTTEYNNAYINDDSYGGVLCCKDPTLCDNDSQDAMCRANGDVHIRMFDGTYYHYMGEGYYDYVAPCDDTKYMPFLITGRQDQCPPWDPYTCLFEVVVTVEDGTQISFPRDGSDPTSNGAPKVGTFTFTNGEYTTSATSFSGTFTDPLTGDVVTISFSYSGYSLKVTTSSDCMTDRICGLCGNVNGDASDDFTKRDGSQVDNTGSGTWPVPDDIWDNTNEFGDSWCNEDLTNNPDCVVTDVEQPSQECLDAATMQCEYVYAMYCSDCGANEINYDEFLEACRFDACAASGGNLGDYSVQDGINNGYFDSSLDSCQAFCENVPREPIVVPCYVCNDKCKHLTNVFGCVGNECLDTCKDCISDIDWWDYANGQSNQCQCHHNGCDQCQDGFFKIDYDFPCQSCSGLIGCLHCTDFWGCQQCSQGYTMVESSTCGEDSNLNTGNTKFHYCVPSDGSDCTVGDTRVPQDTPSPTPATPSPITKPDCPNQCNSNPCDCSTDYNCNDCQSWGCVTCNYGFFKKSWGHECTSCSEYDANCLSCNDWSGCSSCAYGYSVTYDSTCGLNLCAPN